ncbi:trypco2 family protein [Streptomyces sp.]|uniref:trypco2 family protein n=1 Tax=Streptomyces sp. TaxID=1931 RepID=UPI002F3E7E42
MSTSDPAQPALAGIELADAVEAIRQGLITGAARGAGQSIRFEVGEIRMDFTVELQRVRTGRGGVKAWVVEVGGESARTAGRTHTVSFTLRPKDVATGGHVEIGAPDEDDASSFLFGA